MNQSIFLSFFLPSFLLLLPILWVNFTLKTHQTFNLLTYPTRDKLEHNAAVAQALSKQHLTVTCSNTGNLWATITCWYLLNLSILVRAQGVSQPAMHNYFLLSWVPDRTSLSIKGCCCCFYTRYSQPVALLVRRCEPTHLPWRNRCSHLSGTLSWHCYHRRVNGLPLVDQHPVHWTSSEVQRKLLWDCHENENKQLRQDQTYISTVDLVFSYLNCVPQNSNLVSI